MDLDRCGSLLNTDSAKAEFLLKLSVEQVRIFMSRFKKTKCTEIYEKW